MRRVVFCLKKARMLRDRQARRRCGRRRAGENMRIEDSGNRRTGNVRATGARSYQRFRCVYVRPTPRHAAVVKMLNAEARLVG